MPKTAAKDQDVVGIVDIATRLDTQPNTVKAWRARGHLPEPRWSVSGFPAWDWVKDIAPWARETGRLE